MSSKRSLEAPDAALSCPPWRPKMASPLQKVTGWRKQCRLQERGEVFWMTSPDPTGSGSRCGRNGGPVAAVRKERRSGQPADPRADDADVSLRKFASRSARPSTTRSPV